MEFKEIFIMSLIVGLFTFSLISFSITFSQQNDAPVNINQNPIVNRMFGNISVELNKSTANADAARQGLIEEEKNPIITTLGFVFNSILSAGNTFMAMGIGMFTYIFQFTQEILGVPAIVIGTFMAILIGVLVLGIWSLVRAGR